MPDQTGSPSSKSISVSGLVRKSAPVLLAFALFAAGLYALYRLLEPVDIKDVVAQAQMMPMPKLLAAFAATFAGYLALVGYDWSALRYLGRHIPLPVIVVGGFLGYSFGNTIGVSAISGGAVRFRIYSAYGLNAFEVAAISTFVSLAFGIGIVIVGLTALALHPYALGEMISWPPDQVRIAAAATALGSMLVMTWLAVSGKVLRIRNFEIPAPSAGILYGQLLFTLADTSMAALTLYVLLPDSAPDFVTFLAIFAAASMLGVLSHVPGGVGVFESVILATLPAAVPIEHAAAALILYRMIFYLVPFVLAMVFVAINEARLARGMFARVFGDVSEQMQPVMRAISSIAPTIAGTASMGLGLWMLVMAVLPAARPSDIDPDDVMITVLLEGGALLSAALGTVVILLALGLFRRIAGAFWLTEAALVGGAVAAILNEMDVKSAVILLIAVVVLLPLRHEFFRSAKLTHEVLSAQWFALVAGIAFCALTILFLTHESTPFSSALWFDFKGDAMTPRALRAGLLAASVLMFFLVYLALRPARMEGQAPSVEALARAEAVLNAHPDADGWLALSGDKNLFFSESGDAFIMYAIEGRSWVALGDPVGPKDGLRELAWAFYDAAFAANARPVFFDVGEQHRTLWAELGMTLHRIGERAVVPLAGFSLASERLAGIRDIQKRAQARGWHVEMTQPPHAPELLTELTEISQSWLGTKGARDKRFSVGVVADEYLSHLPVLVVRDGGKAIAFASILEDRKNKAAAVDLLRFRQGLADDIAPYVLCEVILAYRAKHFREVDLGLTPFADTTIRHVARLWARFGAVLFRHSGPFEGFGALRDYVAGFAPGWQSRYVVVPGQLQPLPVLRDVAVLIAGDDLEARTDAADST